MSDDWNSDGLNDNWDEAHEFGIDLDGGGGGGIDHDDGFDLGVLELFDAADLLGADLVEGFDLAGDGDAVGGLDVHGIVPAALPYGGQFVALMARIGDGALPTSELLSFIAGVSVRNPFTTEQEP